MRAGRFDRLVDLMRRGADIDDGLSMQPGVLAALMENVPAEVKPAPGNEKYINAENAATAPTIFRVPWSPDYEDLNPKDVVRYGGRDYNIVSVVEIGRREALEIAAITETD